MLMAVGLAAWVRGMLNYSLSCHANDISEMTVSPEISLLGEKEEGGGEAERKCETVSAAASLFVFYHMCMCVFVGLLLLLTKHAQSEK